MQYFVTTPRRQLKRPGFAGAPICYQSKAIYCAAVVAATLSLASCGGGGGFAILAGAAAAVAVGGLSAAGGAAAGAAARDELTLMAEQNDREAQYILGSQLRSAETQYYWLCRSASHSHDFQGKSLVRLGEVSEERGDNVRAFSWYTVAAQHGASDANAALGKLTAAMTVEQTGTATQMAANWTPGNCGDLPAFASASREAVTASFARRRTEAQVQWQEKILQFKQTHPYCRFEPNRGSCPKMLSGLEAHRDKVLKAIDDDEKFAWEVNELEGQSVGSM